jgi:hypothetical protein
MTATVERSFATARRARLPRHPLRPYGHVDMRDRPDGTAIFAAICAVLAVPVSFNPFFPLIFSPIGLLAALAGVTRDRPASRRTRLPALVAAAVCIVFFAVGLHAVLVHPHFPE